MTTVAAPAAPAAPAETPATAPAAPATERPAWLPEKFTTPEAFVASYKELEGKLGSVKAPDPAPIVNPTGDAATAAEMAKHGLSMDEFHAEFVKDGKLSEASYAKALAKGVSKADVDTYVEGRKAIAANAEREILADIGGRAEFDRAVAWAKANLPESEIKAFNKAVGGTHDDAKAAVKGLHARFKSFNPNEPNFVKGTQPATGVAGFSNNAQMIAAMRDPRYKTDSAYRAEVSAKVGAMDGFRVGG